MSARARDGRLVHFSTGGGTEDGATKDGATKDGATKDEATKDGATKDGDGAGHGVADRQIRPGDIVHATVTYAAPHHLNSDAPLVAHRRTRAGDVWAAARTAPPAGVSLGMPSMPTR